MSGVNRPLYEHLTVAFPSSLRLLRLFLLFLLSSRLAGFASILSDKNALARAGSVDVAAWQVAAEATADRAGLLLAVDIPAALSLVARERGVQVANGPAELASGVRSCAALGQLLLFTIGDDHLRLRQRLRLSIA